MRGERILIVRLAAIGDVVMASTVIGRIHARNPRASIHWLCGSTAAPLVERFEGVDSVIAVDERRLLRGTVAQRASEMVSVWRRLVGRAYTDVLVLHVDRRYRALVAPLLGARVRTLSRQAQPNALTLIPGRFLGDEYARLIDGCDSIGPLERSASLARVRGIEPVSRERTTRRPRVGLVPGGTRNVLRESALKRWPVDNYAGVARALSADCDVVLFGDRTDDWVRLAFDGTPVEDRIGRTSLVDAVAELSACDLVISHDTGPMHLARLARTPVLALFGPTPPSHFVPPDEETIVLWGGEDLACRPCYDGREFADCDDNVCMKSITLDVVVRTARTMIARSRPATRGGPGLQTPSESALR